MGRKKKGKSKGESVDVQEEHLKKAPHSFVFNRGIVGKNVSELVHDFRRIVEPYTASNLKPRRKNVLKDYVSVAGLLNVTHFVVFTKTDVAVNMRLIRLPRGPTLTFRVNEYSLSRDILSQLKRPHMEPKQFLHHPLLVMNNLSGEGMHLKLMATMFQNMFPSLNINKIRLGAIRRCVLLNYNTEDNTLELRHYNIRAVPVGMSRGVKKLIKTKLPNMGKYSDVSEFLMKGGDLSESEAEQDGPHNEVVLPQDIGGTGNIKSSKSAIRLTEIGPRLKLTLVKIEEGVGEGEVIYHNFISKTEEEINNLKKKREKKKKLKEERKRQQEQNVKKKENTKATMKRKSQAGSKTQEESDVEDPGKPDDATVGGYDDENDDINWFKTEVGEAPDPELFPQRSTTKRKSMEKSTIPAKRQKGSKDADSSLLDKKAKGKANMEAFMKKIKKNKKRKINAKSKGPGKKGGKGRRKR